MASLAEQVLPLVSTDTRDRFRVGNAACRLQLKLPSRKYEVL
jgi:hypothetical protein